MIGADKSFHALVDDLLADAMELPADQRCDFVLKNATDAKVLAETVSLIEHAAELDQEDAAGAMQGRASGDRIGPYHLRWLLGVGSFGEVYFGIRRDLGQRVAIKVLDASVDPSEQARFETEARLLASFDHPNVVRLIDYGRSHTGQLYLVMDLAEGGTLTEWLEQNRPSRRASLLLFVKICDAVQYAHSNLIIHRDIKPSNILMDARGEPKLADFGIVQLLGTLASATSAACCPPVVAGTPAFASPEQLRASQLTTASDVFSLGKVLREILNGPSALPKGDLGTGGDRSSPPGKSDDLDAIIRQCLEQNPQARYANAGELRDEIQAYLDHRPVTAGRHDLVHLARLFALRNQSAVVAAAIAFVLLLGAFIWIWRQNVALENTAKALRTAVAERTERIKRVMEAAEHFEQVQRLDYKVSWHGNPDAHLALAEAEQAMRLAPSLDTLFHAAVCSRALAEVLLRADGKKERLEGWSQLNRAREILQSIKSKDPDYFGVQRELETIDGIRKELEAGTWTGVLGFASERIPPKLRPGSQSLAALADARSARALGDLWQSLGEPVKAVTAYDRAIQLFDRATAGGLNEARHERDECLSLSRAMQ